MPDGALPSREVGSRLALQTGMATIATSSLLFLGNSQVTREVAAALTRMDLEVRYVANAKQAMQALHESTPDLFVVELTAVGLSGVGLADLADVCHELGTRLALVTGRSVFETSSCASLIGAIASLNKWVPVRVTAERITALVTHAHCARELGIVFDPGIPWAENDDELAALVG